MTGTRGRRGTLIALPLLAPSLILIGLFVLGPVLLVFWFSLTDQSLTGVAAERPKFVGLSNYARLLGDPNFYQAVLRTALIILFAAIGGQFLLGLTSALALARRGLVGGSAFASLIILPLVVPETVAAFAWASMFAPGEFGTLNIILGTADLGPVRWLVDHPLPSVMIVIVWRGIAFSMILFSAAIAAVPGDVLEAAAVDGASTRQRIQYVTLPLIKYAIVLYLLLTTITTAGVMGLIYFLTRGGPGSETTVASIYIYLRSFRFFEIGLGSAASVLMLGLVLAVGLLYVRGLRARL